MEKDKQADNPVIYSTPQSKLLRPEICNIVTLSAVLAVSNRPAWPRFHQSILGHPKRDVHSDCRYAGPMTSATDRNSLYRCMCRRCRSENRITSTANVCHLSGKIYLPWR